MSSFLSKSIRFPLILYEDSANAKDMKMAWKKMSVKKLAASLGVNAIEVREKQQLIQLIVKVRKAKGMSREKLARKLSVTQGRVAQIESGIGTSTVSFEVLLNLLVELGYDFKIVTRKTA